MSLHDSRNRFFEKLIKSKPALLFYKGKFLEDKLKSQRVSKSEIYAAIRNNGYSSIEKIEAVILESDGSFSVITATGLEEPSSALADVEK